MMKMILFAIAAILFFTVPSYGQEQQELFGQLANIYIGGDATGSGLIGGFSPWGLFGVIIFSCIGFVAFMYGKKNSEFRPMLIGMALMVYPYFFRGTIVIFLVGITLTAALYFFRE